MQVHTGHVRTYEITFTFLLPGFLVITLHPGHVHVAFVYLRSGLYVRIYYVTRILRSTSTFIHVYVVHVKPEYTSGKMASMLMSVVCTFCSVATHV